MTLVELYKSIGTEGADGQDCHTLLAQTHWFTINADFDPKTGEALPQRLSAFLARVASPATPETLHDRLWRIVEHARSSLKRLFHALNESPRREQALVPIRAVRELDANSFIKLSNRPGRNIREKLAGKPYLQAVRRFQSVNLPENRLLKAFVSRLAEMLEMRQGYLCEKEDELLPKIQAWLLSEEAQAIDRWDNLSPNNTLLSHRDYRRVWDAWRWLQTLDEDITRDFSQRDVRAKTMRLWNDYGCMYAEGTYLFAEMPIFFDYEKFEIRPWQSQLAYARTTAKVDHSFKTKEISDPVCVDLTGLRPRFASRTSACASLGNTFLWQQWKRGDESVDIELFNSDAAYLHPDATSIASTDLFFSNDNNPEHLDRSARAFVSKLREVFKNDTLIWLVPDVLNDFELEITRRNLNARYSLAEPVPRSIAAVFERLDHATIKRDGYAIVVVDTVGGQTCVTKLIARFDDDLKKRQPQTRGFYWERCPPIRMSQWEPGRPEGGKRLEYDIVTIDHEDKWNGGFAPQKPRPIDAGSLKRDSRIGEFDLCIDLEESPVAGGIRLHVLQGQAGDFPLWRDDIPELSVRLKKDGRYQRFYLVSRGKTVEPIRGCTITIPVREYFTLPAGKPFYQFPLFQGENAEELGFSARLDSPAFPLKTDTVCKLKLTFAYGTDEPYKLVFEPLETSLPPIRATWRRTEEVIITDAPAPGYPPPMSWADLRRAPKPGSKETVDLMGRLSSGIERVDRELFIRPQRRVAGEICRHWGVDKNGARFTYAFCEEAKDTVFIHEYELVEGLRYEDFRRGDVVSFELCEYKARFSARRVAKSGYKEDAQLRSLDNIATEELVKTIYLQLYAPFIRIWSDGRSIADGGCPDEFAETAKGVVEYIASLSIQPGIPQKIKNRFLFLLSCLHTDTTSDCVDWITQQVENGNIHNARAVGFALGDISEGWQEYIFSKLASEPNFMAISVFAYAIWREQHFIERFSYLELIATLNVLLGRLKDLQPLKRVSDEVQDKRNIRDWVRTTTEPLELLLGLLRTRASTNPEIRLLLQPHQKITKDLAKQVEQVTELVLQSKIDLFSRVQLSISKPAEDPTPVLLYALRLYLTGDDGANAIQIAGISENDNR